MKKLFIYTIDHNKGKQPLIVTDESSITSDAQLQCEGYVYDWLEQTIEPTLSETTSSNQPSAATDASSITSEAHLQSDDDAFQKAFGCVKPADLHVDEVTERKFLD